MDLARLIVRRLAMGVATLLFVSVLVFGATELLPGDVAEAVLGQDATQQALAAMREELGLDRPAYVRYAQWIGGLLQGDLGTSLASRRPIGQLVATRLPATLLLGATTAAIAIPLALGLGLFSASRAGSLPDRIITGFALFTASGPEFFFAALLVMLFAVKLGWLPATSYLSNNSTWLQQMRALALPGTTLLLSVFAPTTRMTRSAVLNVLSAPYIEMALLKGLPRRRVLLRHALPNAVAPIANVVGISLGYLVSGVVVVEVIFSFPGMAKMMVDGVAVRDLPLIQACAMIFCAIYIGLNLVADLIALAADPRARYRK
jgi:peptide/nickel transport system permease protein